MARMATAGAYLFCRLKHQTNLYETIAGHLWPVHLAGFRTTVEPEFSLLEKALSIGAKECVAARLMAVRMPEAIVNERRRIARQHAKKKGDTPSQSHLELLAWNLFIPNVPHTIWKTETVVNVYPLRWPIALMFKSWKSYLPVASLTTNKEDSTVWYLYGRMRLSLFNYALCPQLRARLWLKKKRELSLLKRVRHFQALAERWMQAIFQPALEVRRFLQRACATAARLGVKASRNRRTTAQILRERLQKHVEAVVVTAVVKA